MSTTQPIQLPGGPAPDQPIPRDPIHGVDLETFAKISAELAERKTARSAILRACGFEEHRWSAVEQGWMVRIATAAMRGDLSLAEELDAHYVAAQDSLGPTDPTRSLDRYAALVARIELGEESAIVLESEGLSLADAARLQRAWTRRFAADRELASTFREWVDKSKRNQPLA